VINRSIGKAVGRSECQSIFQPARQSVSQSNSRWFSQFVGWSLGQIAGRSASKQLVGRSDDASWRFYTTCPSGYCAVWGFYSTKQATQGPIIISVTSLQFPGSKAKRTLDPCARMQSAGVRSITRVGIVRTYSCIFGQLTFVWIRIQCALGLKRTKCESYNSPPSRIEVRNAWSFTSTPPRIHNAMLRLRDVCDTSTFVGL
jgi:hypothetical protein